MRTAKTLTDWTDLSLSWAHKPFVRLCHALAQLYKRVHYENTPIQIYNQIKEKNQTKNTDIFIFLLKT